MLPGSGLSCAFLDELLNYSGLPLSQLLSRYDHSPYLSHEQIKCIKPVPNRQWSLSLCQELLLWLFGAFSECSDAWSNLGKWALWFMSGSSLTRLNVVRRTGVRQVSSVRNDFVCLAFPTVLWRARSRWPRSAAVCTRWSPLTRARPPRTALDLSWPPWGSSRMPTSCARSSASSWRQSAPTWRCVFPSPPVRPVITWKDACWVFIHRCRLMTRPDHGHEGCLVSPVELGLDSECCSFLLYFREACLFL